MSKGAADDAGLAAAGLKTPPRRGSLTKMARPLQICEIDFEGNCVKTCHESLEIIEENLQELAKSMSKPDLKVAVISVMGMYRTGKSFLLDLLLRYLKSQGPITKFDASKIWHMGEKSYNTDSYSWLGNETRISEGSTNERGFHWRPGIEKCTKGIWLWSEPFLMENNETGEPLAVLVMDTQGAWDSQMSSEQSSCIFGITALLSSKLIYNLQNRISEEKVDNLDYFTTYAGIVIQEAREKATRALNSVSPRGDPNAGDGSGASSKEKPVAAAGAATETEDEEEDDAAGLGDIHFLVRDWEYFEDHWTLDQCTKQVSDHLMTHLDPNRVTVEERRETITRLHNLFRSVNLCCLPHPGPRIPKANWNGSVTDIDTDFLYLLTHFFANLSHGEYPLKVAAPLGQELTAKSFCRVVETLATAFKSARPDATSLRKAFVTCETHRAKEEALDSFSKAVGNTLSGDMLEPEVMSEKLANVKKEQMSLFKSRIKTLFTGSSKEEEQWKEQLLEEMQIALEEKATVLAERNETAYTQATWKLVATPVLTVPVCMSILSLPHLLLYACVAAGGAFHLNTRAGDEGVQGWFAPDVLERVFQDIKAFMTQRYIDVKQMSFVARRCDKLPQQITNTVSGANLAAAGAVASGAAKMATDKAKNAAAL